MVLGMTTLAEVQQGADRLSHEDRTGLLAHLIHTLPNAPSGADDAEVLRRENEMDSGQVEPISHDEFVAQVRSGSR